MIYEIIRNISWSLVLISYIELLKLYVRVPVESCVLVFYLDIEFLQLLSFSML